MKLILPLPIIERLKRELRGRRHEMGGVLVGEHVDSDTFQLVDISFQKTGGTAVHFVRDPLHHRVFLADFFARTGGNYRRFNYIGEWHSHPSFEPSPSGEDIATMFDLVDDPDVGVNFAILIIARLERWHRLQMSATLFRSGVAPERISVEIGQERLTAKASAISRLMGFLRR